MKEGGDKKNKEGKTRRGHQNGNKEQKPMRGLQDEGRRTVETFAAASLADQAKLNGTFMCTCWHT
jgi:hypothetical protein